MLCGELVAAEFRLAPRLLYLEVVPQTGTSTTQDSPIHFVPFSEANTMSKRFNPSFSRKRSRQGEAFAPGLDAEFDSGFEVGGFADEIEDEDEEEESEDLEEEGFMEEEEETVSDVDATDDPVRIYLMQMGEIPLLTRQQELTSAIRIEATRTYYRNWMVATDFILQGATKLLEQVRDGKLRLDRTIEVSVTNAAEKTAIMKRIGPNIQTLRHLLLRNHGDFHLAIDRTAALADRKAAWKRLVRRRNKALRLIEEMNLRTNRLEPMFVKLTAISDRMQSLKAKYEVAKKEGFADGMSLVEIRRELCQLMRITYESRLPWLDAFNESRSIEKLSMPLSETCRPVTFAWSFRSPRNIEIAD